MAATIGGLLTDPDSLGYEIAANTASTSRELVIDTTRKLLKLTRTGNLTADGVTLKCIHSKLKEVWNTDSALTPLDFPINPITDEQYELINGWNWDKALNPDTRITVTSVTGVANTATLTVTTSNFNTSNVFKGAKITGNVNLGANVTVTDIVSNTEIRLSAVNTGSVFGTLTFFTDCDYTYNLVRTAGWAVKSTTTSASSEEWIGVISLGSIGQQGQALTLAITENITNSNVITVSSTTGIVAGSWVHAKNLPFGATVSSVISSTQFSVTKNISSLPSGALVTIKSSQQPYYQIGTEATLPIDTIQPGQVNQPIQVYNQAQSIDLRNSTVTRMFLREQAWTYALTTAQDIGISSLTYQTYRFNLSNETDILKITHTDAEISSTGITPTATPWSNMSITWYSTPQPRVIGGSTYFFNVIIDADTTQTEVDAFGNAAAEQVYEFVQWALRREVGIDIDSSPSTSKVGKTTRELLEWVGETLYTIYDPADGGVYIDHFKKEDINRIVFSDNTDRRFPYVSFGTINFVGDIVTDQQDAVYRLFYKQINQNGESKAYGNTNAVIVKSFSSDPSYDGTLEVKGNLQGGLTTVNFDYDWDKNSQLTWTANTAYKAGDQYRHEIGSITRYYQVTTNYTSGSTWQAAPGADGANAMEISGPTAVLVTVGLTNGQWYKIEANIAKSNNNVITAVPAKELNYVEYVYGDLSATNITGTGSSAKFTVIARGTNYNIIVTTAGTGYAAGNKVKILGTQVGGATPTNDITITVETVANVAIGNISTISWT